MTLKEVSEAISVLQAYAAQANMDANDLNQKNKDLFFALFQEDSFFVVSKESLTDEQKKEKSFVPYAAPAAKDSSLSYLRLFSHREAAEAFLASQQMEGSIIPISAMESVQLAKFWLLRGVYGFMLNDGQQWATISFTDYLYSVFHDLLNREDMYNEVYVELINFLVYFSAHEPFFLAEQNEHEIAASQSLTIYFIGPEEKKDGFIYTPLSTELLNELMPKENELVIEALCSHIRTTMPLLRRVFSEFSVAQESNPSSFRDLKFVNLDFLPDEDSSVGNSFEEDELREEPPITEKDSKQAEANPLPEKLRTMQAALCEKFKTLRNQWFSKKKEKPTEPEPQEPIEPEQPEEAIPEKRKFPKKKILAIGAALVLVFLGVFMVRGFFSDRSEFERDLQDGNYKEAYLTYQDNTSFGFAVWANEIVSTEITNTINDYAQNEIDAAEAGRRLQGLNIFAPTHEEELSQALTQAKKLEASKNAYISGASYMEQKNYLQALSDWTLVIKEDVNYTSMMQMIESNEDVLKLQGLLQCKDYLLRGDQNRYQAGIDILHQWFPWDQDISDEWSALNQGSSFENQDPAQTTNPFDPMTQIPEQPNGEKLDPVGDLPIRIDKMKVGLPGHDTGRTLYIGWTNQSGKTIQSITFTVQAANEMGEVQTCTRNGYSDYEATATGPFESGEGLDGKQGWEDAWYGTQIQKAILKGVFIQYSDGTAVNLTDTTTLQTLQSEASGW